MDCMQNFTQFIRDGWKDGLYYCYGGRMFLLLLQSENFGGAAEGAKLNSHRQ